MSLVDDAPLKLALAAQGGTLPGRSVRAGAADAVPVSAKPPTVLAATAAMAMRGSLRKEVPFSNGTPRTRNGSRT